MVPPTVPHSVLQALLASLMPHRPPAAPAPPQVPLAILMAAINDGTVRSPFPATVGPYFSGPSSYTPGEYDIDFSRLGYGGQNLRTDPLVGTPANKNNYYGPRSK